MARELAVPDTGRKSTILKANTVNKSVSSANSTLNRLQNQWLRIALLWLGAWLVIFLLLQRHWAYANRWLLLSGLFSLFTLWRIRQNLIFNHRPGDYVLSISLGLANHITFLRGFLVCILAGFLFSPWPQGALAWTIAGIYTLAGLADAFDGYVARRGSQVTELGRLLDMEFDGLGVAVVTVLAIGYGQLLPWFLLVGFARYLFVFGLWWRARRDKAVYDLPDSSRRRILAGILMGMLTVVLWPIVPPPMSHIAAAVIGIPLLLGFLRDWLFASGRLTTGSSAYQQIRHFSSRLLTSWLPLVWRIILVVTLINMLSAAQSQFRLGAWEELLRSWGMPAAPQLAVLLAAAAVLGVLLIALGIAGRLASVLLLFPIGFDITMAGLTWQNGLALTSALMIAQFGSGPYSLWQPEEAFLVPRGGPSSAHEENNNAK
jgi:CDP-diacylglycerol---glycerol-3-phosphate 3-phosphatidyltransferase